MEQVLYSLPEGWHLETIGEVASKLVTGKTPSTKKAEYYSSSEVDWFTPSDFGSTAVLNNSRRKLSSLAIEDGTIKKMPKGSILLVAIGATIGKVGLAEDESCFNQQVTGIHFKEKIHPKYAYYWLSYIKPEIITKSSQATLPIINQTGIKGLSFLYPEKEEQKRIVEKLDALLTRIDTAIEHLQESVTLADALSQNGLDVYFAELTETNPELTLSKLADFISGYAFKSGDFTSESGIKPIKITNVGVNEFSENAEEFLPASYESEYQRFAAKTNDIVIALTRPIINGGLKVCRVPESYSGALVNQRVAAITSKNKHVLDFIYLYLQSSRTKNYVLEKSKSLNQPNLSITDLKNLALPLPANDKAIAKAVADCNALISKARKSKAEFSEKIIMMQQLKASILYSAFKGEL